MASAAFCSESREGSCSGGTGMLASQLAFDWKLEKGLRSLDDWPVTLWSARGALKVRVFDVSKEVAFEAVFDSGALETAGMDARLGFEENADTVQNALKGEGFAKANGVLLVESHAVLSISEETPRRTFEYRLKLLCAPLTESDTLRMELASTKKQLAAASTELEIQARDYRNTFEEMRLEMEGTLRDAVCSGDVVKQQLAECRSELAAATKKISNIRAQFGSERIALKQKLAKAKKQIADLILDTKTPTTAASHSGTISEELLEANAKAMAECRALKQRLAKEKTHSAVEYRAAGDLCAEIRTDDAPIAELTEFFFDTKKKSAKKWNISVDGKCATTKTQTRLISLTPIVCTDKQICIVLENISGFVGVGVTDSSEGLSYGCRFDSRGHVTVRNSVVAKLQSFGGWHSGDRLIVSANVSSGTVSIRAPNGEFSVKWTPCSSICWFGVMCGSVGDKVRID